MGDSVSVTLRDEAQVRTFENAIDAVEDDLGVEVSRTRGRPGEGEISMGEAVTELAAAYTGIDRREGSDG